MHCIFSIPELFFITVVVLIGNLYIFCHVSVFFTVHLQENLWILVLALYKIGVLLYQRKLK